MSNKLKEYLEKKAELKELRSELVTWSSYGEFDENYKQCEEEVTEFIKTCGFVHDHTETDSYTGNWIFTYIGYVEFPEKFFNEIIAIEHKYDIEDTLDKLERATRYQI